ncbi:MAG: acyltransferase [Methanobrevibacter sp.]|uniref:acyltransferase n=1 Tax=Methanobrevibacter sp. TaxID=66852 RepID=UPI002E77A37D|nr:acyltransferase [Methanobrevibacter sp.]MEE0935217.1 acyltransferase [Methanobrevibacter sp.]
MKTKERIFYYDLLRAFAIIAVIMCHVNFYFGPLNTPAGIIFQQTFNNIGRLGVPIFLMISGALLLNRDYPSLGDFLKRRFTRIIYPFIFWMILITLTNMHFHKSYAYMWNVFIGNPSIAWYFWTLIGIYLAVPIINIFIKEYGEKGCEYFLAIWFVFIILNTLNIYPILPHLKLDWFTGFIGYPILGYYLSTKKFNIADSKMWKLGLFILLILFVILIYYPLGDLTSTVELMYQNLPVVIMGIGMFLFIQYLDKENKFNSIKNNAIGKAISSISLCSYGMYFSHVIIIMFMSKINPHSNMLFPAMFALTIFLSWLLPYVFSKIPYIKKVSGV